MKISTLISVMVMVSAIFFIFSSMVQESNEQYPEVNINSSDWEDRYDYVEDINSSVYPIEEKLKVIQDENAGFFTKIGAGITALPYAIIVVPHATFNSISIASKMIIDFFMVFGLPSYIITIALLLLLVWAIFKLVEFFQGNRI